MDEPNPPPSVKVFSQPEGISLECIRSYTYREEEQGAARIYLVDSGANIEHDAYKSLAVEPDWIWSGTAEDAADPYHGFDINYGQKGDRAFDSSYHGTCMLSLAIGKTAQTWGISRKADVTIVSLPRRKANPYEISQGVTSVPYAPPKPARDDALEKVLQDVSKRGPQRRAVILLALGAPSEPIVDASGNPTVLNSDNSFYWVVKELSEAGVVIVAAAGNSGDSPTLWLRKVRPKLASDCT